MEHQNDSTSELITTGRKTLDYCDGLGIDQELLRKVKVLNVGCGASNLRVPTVDKKHRNITNIDLQFDPYFALMTNPVGSLVARIAEKMLPKNVALKRKIAGTQDRVIAQADMKAMPFANNSFDIALAYWSLYLLPLSQREKAIREMIRAGKVVHIYPVFKKDVEIINKILEDGEVTVVSCVPPPGMMNDLPFRAKEMNDYATHIQKHPELDDRGFLPDQEDVKYSKILGRKVADASRGFLLILAKKQFLKT